MILLLIFCAADLRDGGRTIATATLAGNAALLTALGGQASWAIVSSRPFRQTSPLKRRLVRRFFAVDRRNIRRGSHALFLHRAIRAVRVFAFGVRTISAVSANTCGAIAFAFVCRIGIGFLFVA
jgi:hypothetical protein